MNPKYSVGQRIGSLTIVSVIKSQKKNSRCTIYECKCDCGNTVKRDSGYFYRSVVNNCGCYNPSKKENREDQIIKRLFKEKIHNVKCRHSNDNSFFSMTFEQYKEIIKKPCFYCGISHSMERKDMVKDKVSTNTIVRYNGIDRIENGIGYTIENSVPCCTHCNLAKRMLTQQEFLNWVKRIYEFRFLNQPPTKATELPYKTKWH